MTCEYMENRLMLVAVATSGALGLDYFQAEVIDIERILVKTLIMSAIIFVLSLEEIWWKGSWRREV